MTCSICAAPSREVLELALVAGGSIRGIASRHGVSRSALARHVAGGHVPVTLLDAEAARTSMRGASLTDRAEALWHRAEAILTEAEREGRATVALASIRELRACVELLGKLTGAFAVVEDRPVIVALSFADGRPLPDRRHDGPTLRGLPGGEGA